MFREKVKVIGNLRI